MNTRPRPALAIGAALLAQGLLIAAAFAWVAFYSHVIAPGQPFSAYEAYAQRASPWVSVAVGMPLFFALARWALRPAATAWAACGLYLVLDAALLALVLAGGGSLPWPMVLLSYATKMAACALGVRMAGAALHSAA
jgi:hypothetical protein